MSGQDEGAEQGVGGDALAYTTQNQQQMAMNAQLLQQHATHQQQLILQQFWMNVMNEIQNINPDQEDFKSHALPLARIKKIMKSEEEILNDAPNAPNSRFMISAEAPIMFAKACEIFIAELTTRSWGHTEENKRRTLQRNDISVAVSKTDTFDFLIDIVPREEIKAGEEPVQRPINAASPLGAQQQQDPNVMYQQMQLAQAQQMQAQMAQMDPTQQMQYMQMIAAQQQQPYAQMVMYQQQQQQMAQMQAMQAQQAGHMGEMEAAMHGNEENQNLNVMQHPDMNKDLQNYSAEQQQMMMYQQALQQQQQQMQQQQMMQQQLAMQRAGQQ